MIDVAAAFCLQQLPLVPTLVDCEPLQGQLGDVIHPRSCVLAGPQPSWAVPGNVRHSQAPRGRPYQVAEPRLTPQ